MKIPLLLFKMGLFIFAVCLGFLFIGYQWGGRAGLFGALVFALAWMSLIWTSDEKRWLEVLNTHPVEGQDPWGVLSLIDEGCRRLHTDKPIVLLANSRSAFLLSLTLGLTRDILIVSRPVLQHFSKPELEALLLSELASLWLRKKFIYRWLHLMALSLVRLSEIFETLIPWGRRNGIFRRMTAPLSQIGLRFFLWNRFEVERDQLTVSIIPDRRPLATAMCKLKALGQAYPLAAPLGSEHLFLVPPNRKDDETHFLSLHSPLSVRLRRILGAELI